MSAVAIATPKIAELIFSFFVLAIINATPPQKAIKTYITSQIGGGASTLNVNQITAGLVQISGQEITTTTVVPINVNATMNFKGGVDGTPVALNMFLMG